MTADTTARPTYWPPMIAAGGSGRPATLTTIARGVSMNQVMRCRIRNAKATRLITTSHGDAAVSRKSSYADSPCPIARTNSVR
jgi:hypothetical protein